MRTWTLCPSFEVISPLLSRTKVYVLDPLTTPQIAELLRRALNDKEHGFGNESIAAPDDILFRIASFANGDARAAYNTLELAVRSARPEEKGAQAITKDLLEDVLQRKLLRYDKAGEEHFNLISALHKSVRNSVSDKAVAIQCARFIRPMLKLFANRTRDLSGRGRGHTDVMIYFTSFLPIADERSVSKP